MKGAKKTNNRRIVIIVLSSSLMLGMFYSVLCRIEWHESLNMTEGKITVNIQEYEMSETGVDTRVSTDYDVADNTSDNIITSESITTMMDTEDQNSTSYVGNNTEFITTTETILTDESVLSQEHQQTTSVTEHQHKFVTDITYIHHTEKGHYEDVCVVQGYEEEVYEFYDKYCYYCGAIMDSWSFNDIMDHSAIHGAYGTYDKVIKTVWHEPEYEKRWIVDTEAYYEEVIKEICSECGYAK